MAIAALDPLVDAFHLMTYDYAVSDITGAVALSPNAPLFTPSSPNAVQMSINYTVMNYLAADIEPSKIYVGIALYGHSFYAPGLTGSAWSKFGANASNSGLCCGPLKATMGGAPGQITSQCGTFMYSEVVAAGATLHAYDNETQSDIAYFAAQGADGYTPAGTWVTYTGLQSAAAITDYAVANKLGAVFIFDSSMDTMEAGAWTYQMTNHIADRAAGISRND